MDIQAFNAIASRLRPALRDAAGRWLADAPRGCDEPDDIVQDTLLRLWSVRESLDSYRSIEALAMVAARRMAIDAIRRSGARPAESLTAEADAIDPSTLPDEAADEAFNASLVSALLARLPDRQAAIVRMHHADGLSNTEIAELTGMTEGNVRTALSRGRRRIRELYLSSSSTAI